MRKSFGYENIRKKIRVVRLRQIVVGKIPQFELFLLSTPNLKNEYSRVLKDGKRREGYSKDYYRFITLGERLDTIEKVLKGRGVNLQPLIKKRKLVLIN